MDLIRAIVLGILQGATEFAPVSSSGHLVLVPWLLGWPEPGLVFDTMVHWGTLTAVLVYFWRDWWTLIKAWVQGLIHWDWQDGHARLMWLLILGTIPAMVIGLLLEDLFESLFSQPVWVSLFLFVTAGILIVSEKWSARNRGVEQLSWLDALLIGLGQAAAIAPGVSRSGSTMAVGLLRGLDRASAARFSFLLSTPIILGAGALQLLDLFSVPGLLSQAPLLAVGFMAAALSGYACISGLLRYLQRGKLYPFALYCVLFGAFCLVVSLVR